MKKKRKKKPRWRERIYKTLRQKSNLVTKENERKDKYKNADNCKGESSSMKEEGYEVGAMHVG